MYSLPRLEMRHPLDLVIPSDYRRGVLISLLVPTVLLWGILRSLQAGLNTGTTGKAPQGMLSFELAGDPLVTHAIFNAGAGGWDAASITSAETALLLDYAFLLCYSTTLALGCVWASKLWVTPRMTELGAWLAWGQLAAAICHAMENFALLRIAQDSFSTSFFIATGVVQDGFAISFARFCAFAKYGLIEAGLLYIAISGFNLGIGPVLRLRLSPRRLIASAK